MVGRAKKRETLRIRISTEIGENDTEDAPEVYLVLELGKREREILESVAVRSVEKELPYVFGQRYGIKSFVYQSYGKQPILFAKDLIDTGKAKLRVRADYVYELPSLIEGIVAAFSETVRAALVGNKEFEAVINVNYKDRVDL